MKKLLALALCALMLISAALPVFAADDPIVLTANTELPAEFKNATKLHAKDFKGDNSSLVEYNVSEGPGDNGQFAFYSGYGSDDTLILLPEAQYGMTFETEEAGTYHFCVVHFVRGDDAWAEGKNWWHGGQQRIDNGPTYEINEKDVTGLNKSALHYYTGITVELDAGEHTFYFIGTRSNGLTLYLSDVYYYMEGDEPAADDKAEDTTAAPSEEPKTPVEAGAPTADVPAGFEDAEVVNFADQATTANEFSWAGNTCWPWNSNDFRVDGQFEPLGKNTILMAGADFVYNVEFMAYEDGPHDLALYLVNKTTKNGANTPLDEAIASGFTLTLKDEDGKTVGSYTITEKQPAEVGSKLYYVFAEDVELAADTYYTLSVQLTAPTQSCLVDLLVAAPSAASEGGEDPVDDTTAADDTTTPSTGEQTSPATFDIALIAIAVAGASAAAAAVVSKKRR